MDKITDPGKLAKEAKSQYQKGEFLEAAGSFQAAQQGFLEQNDRLNAAEMANNASVAFLQADMAEAAYAAAKGTPDVFAELGDLTRQAMALGNLGSAAEALGKRDEASDLFQQSANILSQTGEDQLRAAVMQSLSMLQLKSGRQLEALTTMQSGLNGVKRPNPKQSFIKKLLRIPIDMAMRGKS